MGRAAIRGLDVARRRDRAASSSAGQDYQKLKAQAAHARLQARAARADGVDVVQTDDAHDRFAERRREDHGQRSDAQERVRRLHRPLGSPRHRRRRSTATRSTTARATTRAARRCCSSSRAQFKKVQPAPKRSILFLCVTAEEQGLLGSEYYAKFPLYPLDEDARRTSTSTSMNVWGRTKDLTVIGLGASDLDDYARDAAAEQGRVLHARRRAGEGLLLPLRPLQLREGRRAGVRPGLGHATSSASRRATARRNATSTRRSSTTSAIRRGEARWDLAGAAEDGQLFFAMGYRVANADKFPEWKPGNEFKAIRDKSLK